MIRELRLMVAELPIAQRVGIGLGALVTAVLVVAFVLWAGRTTMEAAFSSLAVEEAAAITEALREAKVPFEMADAGATILVPAPRVADARMAAAAAGAMPDSLTGFEIFDRQGFGASEFDQAVTYQRAIEGKLARTIRSMDGVAEATVSIVQARQGLFSEQDTPASASVNLRMRTGAPPEPAMVRGIVSTVTGAVAGLEPDNVTVVDADGRVLSGAAGNDEIGNAATAHAAVESNLSAKVQRLVDRALGPGHASVAVSVELDMDRVEEERTTVAPIDANNWTPASVQRTDERYTGNGAPAFGGIPGSGSNIPGLPTYPGSVIPPASPGASPAAPTDPAAPAAGGYSRAQETVNYANSQTVERIVRSGGAIKRLSVAVLLDEAAMDSVASPTLEQAIAAAIGVDPKRGDVVEVSAVAFADAPEPEPAGLLPPDLAEGAGTAATWVGAALLALVLMVLVWRNARAIGQRTEAARLPYRMAHPAELPAGYGPAAEAAAIRGLPELAGSAQGRVQERLRSFADEKPEELAGLVSTWLRQDGRP